MSIWDDACFLVYLKYTAMKSLRVPILALLFFSCGGLSTSNLETILDENKKELADVANQFLKHKEIKQLTIATDYDSTKCQSINAWLNCPTVGKKWKTWNDSLQTNIYLNSRFEVLKHENIEIATYDFFCKFLRNQEFTHISRGYFACGNCVEFESFNNGLRFYTSSPNELKKNYEYLYVKRLDANWFVYTRDWN